MGNLFIRISMRVSEEQFSLPAGTSEIEIQIPRELVGKIEFGNVLNVTIASAVLDLEKQKEESKNEAASS